MVEIFEGKSSLLPKIKLDSLATVKTGIMKKK